MRSFASDSTDHYYSDMSGLGDIPMEEHSSSSPKTTGRIDQLSIPFCVVVRLVVSTSMHTIWVPVSHHLNLRFSRSTARTRRPANHLANRCCK